MEVICGKNETLKEVKRVELIVVIGNKVNAATNDLYDLALYYCRNAMIVESMKDVYLNYISRFKIIGVMVDTTASKELANEVIQILKNTETEKWIYENSR